MFKLFKVFAFCEQRTQLLQFGTVEMFHPDQVNEPMGNFWILKSDSHIHM